MIRRPVRRTHRPLAESMSVPRASSTGSAKGTSARRLRAIAAMVGIGLVGAGVGTGAAAPAWAAAGVTITSTQGAGVADPDYATDITVAGSGFQSIRNGFGGVYVLFGWVDDPQGRSWAPSRGGVVGKDYRYVPDSEAKDNAGYERFVAFPGSETASAAQAIMGDDGSWTVTMVIPGARFESLDRNGKATQVDCTKVTCGIITIGAHGVKNANNETFTPVRFAAPAASGGKTATSTPDAAPAATTTARVGVASQSVAAGSSVVFTGQGFTAGEQVIADLDQGVVAVGPLTAGASGEVAGALPVPADVRAGTHLVTLRGASSGRVAESEVAVTSTAAATAAPAATGAPVWAVVVLVLCIAIAAALVVASAVVSIRRARARRRAAKAAIATAPAAAAPPGSPDAQTRPIDAADVAGGVR
jgi:hypothetical protein